MHSLSELFIEHAGNISDKWEHYLAIYDAELARFRQSGNPISLLEIGVQNGGSLQLFAKYLPAGSQVVGVDVDAACAGLSLGPNIRVAIADAAKPDSLAAALQDEQFDVILDDGSHESAHIMVAFRACFDRLRPGGLYIVEDLHASYWPTHGGGLRRPESAIECFKQLVDALNADHFYDATAPLEPDELSWLQQAGAQIGRITFYDSVAVLEKLDEPKKNPYRRVITGALAPVSDPALQIAHMPVSHLKSLILAPAAEGAFAPALLESVSAARDELAQLRSEMLEAEERAKQCADQRESEAASIIRGLMAARAEAEERRAEAQASRNEARMLLAATQASLQEARASLNVLQQSLMEARSRLAEAEGREGG